MPSTLVGWLIAGALGLLALLGYIFRSWLTKKVEPYIDSGMNRVRANVIGWVRGVRGRVGRPSVNPQDIKVEIRERDIRERDERPVGVLLDFTAAIPQVRLWFDVTNDTEFDLVMDRLLIELWVFAPVLYGLENGILTRQVLPKKSGIKDVNYFRDLSTEHAQRIGEQAVFNQSANRWEVRATVHVVGWFVAPRVGWISTGKRKVFHHDSLPVLGVPPRKQAVVTGKQPEPGVERKVIVRQTLHRLSTDLTNYASGNYGSEDYSSLMSQLASDLATVRLECPNLFFHVNKIAEYLGDVNSPRSAGYVNGQLLTPLMFDARKYLE
jgi:hypothetical protein